jgi:uncharacterized protein (TIGR01655 family)
MKTAVKIILAVAAVAIVVVIVVWFKGYYDNRYVGSDYYTQVPATYNITPQSLKDDSGEVYAKGVEYDLTAYDADGQPKSVSFRVESGEKAFPKPGQYLCVKASTTLTLGWSVVSRSDVPVGALEAMKVQAKQ